MIAAVEPNLITSVPNPDQSESWCEFYMRMKERLWKIYLFFFHSWVNGSP